MRSTMGRRGMKTFGPTAASETEEEYRKRNEAPAKRKRAPKNRGTEIERGYANTVCSSLRVVCGYHDPATVS